MSVGISLGLADHGHPVTLEEFESAEFEEGYKYELIDGRLYVSPAPNYPEDYDLSWLFEKLVEYKRRHPGVIGHLSQKARVFVPGRSEVTCPEPDISVYGAFRANQPVGRRTWRSMSPILVVEVLFDADPHKDLVRNVELYLQVPSVREYWILDARDTPEQPTLIVHRRRGRRWVTREYEFGQVCRTQLLPGFSLRIDPSR
jgi:Uma2 family endonuclease